MRRSPSVSRTLRSLLRRSRTKPLNHLVRRLLDALKDLGYDDYRKIRFRPEMALWRDKHLFEIQLFHLGFVHRLPVRINLIQDNQIVQVLMRPEMFDYSDVKLPQDLPTDLGFAGFRLHYPLHTPDYKDEVAVFLGASYFRIVGRDQRFGASARGLAIDTLFPTARNSRCFASSGLSSPASMKPRSPFMPYSIVSGLPEPTSSVSNRERK